MVPRQNVAGQMSREKNVAGTRDKMSRDIMSKGVGRIHTCNNSDRLVQWCTTFWRRIKWCGTKCRKHNMSQRQNIVKKSCS